MRGLPLLAIWCVCAFAACRRSEPPDEVVQQSVENTVPAGQLPPGVSDVRFGHAERVRSAGEGQTCSIPQPLPDPPVFAAGTTQLAFTARLDPDIAKDADATLTGPGLPEVRGTRCDAYSVSVGHVQLTQMGSSFVRSDGKTWPAGTYTLTVRVNGVAASLPFAVQ